MNEQGLFALGLGLLTTGFLGSWHCAAMCGPIACLAQSRGQLLAYQLGRVTSYTVLGVLAGTLGRVLFHHQIWWVRVASLTILMGVIFFLCLNLALDLMGPIFSWSRCFSWLRDGSRSSWIGFLKSSWCVHIENILKWFRTHFNEIFFQNYQKYATRTGFGMGFLSILLPCAWLYTFVAGAAATQSGWAGGLIMFFFALSAIPALSLAPQFFSRVLKGSSNRQKALSLVVLSFAAVYALVAHFV
jgi:sulfite exporter TauE/SafE